jgi:hypothetical protein
MIPLLTFPCVNLQPQETEDFWRRSTIRSGSDNQRSCSDRLAALASSGPRRLDVRYSSATILFTISTRQRVAIKKESTCLRIKRISLRLATRLSEMVKLMALTHTLLDLRRLDVY